MNKRKTINKINIPKPLGILDVKKTLPFNGKAVSEKSFSFSFACFDRSHKLFNLGDNSTTGTVSANWFLDLIDCFKSISNMNFSEMQASLHDLHRIDWNKTNTQAPFSCKNEDYDYYQFRINKSKGRIIGILIDNIFYVVWLDPHHNLTNSEGYGKETYHKAGMSEYEKMELKIRQLQKENEHLKDELQTAEELLNEYAEQQKQNHT